MGDDGSVEFSHLEFRALQRIRIHDSAINSNQLHKGIAIATKFQIGIVASSTNTLTSFSTKTIPTLILNRQNANKDYTDLPRKQVPLDSASTIHSLGMNSDDSLLGVLLSNPSGAFVYVFDTLAFSPEYAGDVYQLCAIRIGADQSSKGMAFEWNPAIADTFAASSSDNTVVVAKIDAKNPSAVSMIGNKRLGAAITHISWSPKGKQLVVGDALGKIAQLKPELDVVRVTMAPTIPGIPETTTTQVCGLCWLATTEWLVSYSVPDKADIFAYVLTLKKDKPASWKQLSDLAYGNPLSPLSPCLSSSASLLIPWELVITTSAKTSEVCVVGRINEAWNVWTLEDSFCVNLPTDSARKETFPLGIAVDLSSSTNVVLSEDGSSMHRPSPILMVLTTDGLILPYSVVSKWEGHKPCQVAPSPVNVSAVRVGKRPEGQAVPTIATTTAASAPSGGSLFGLASAVSSAMSKPMTFGASTSTSAPSPAPTVPASSTGGLFGILPTASSKPAVPTNLFGRATTAAAVPVSTGSPLSSLLATGTTTLAATAQPGVPKMSEVNSTVSASATTQSTVPISSAPSEPASMPVVAAPPQPPAPPVESEESKVSRKTKQVQMSLDRMKKEWDFLVSDLRALQVGIQNAGKTVKTADDVLNTDDSDVMNEMTKLKIDLEASYSKLEAGLKASFVSAAEKMEIAESYDNDKERVRVMKDKDDFDRDERMKRLVMRMDDLKEKYADAKKQLTVVKKLNVKVPMGLVSSSVIEDKLTQQQTKAVNRSINNLRSKIDSLENDMMQLNISKKKASKAVSGANTSDAQIAPQINVLKLQPVPDPTGNVAAMRQRMRDILAKKAKDPSSSKVRDLVSLPFVQQESMYGRGTADSMTLTQLKEHVIKMASPRSIRPPATPKSDAATQADAPPPAVLVIEEKKLPPMLSFSPGPASSQPPKSTTTTGGTSTSFSSTPVTKMFGRPSSSDETMTPGTKAFEQHSIGKPPMASTPAVSGSAAGSTKSFFGAGGEKTSSMFSPIAASGETFIVKSEDKNETEKDAKPPAPPTTEPALDTTVDEPPKPATVEPAAETKPASTPVVTSTPETTSSVSKNLFGVPAASTAPATTSAGSTNPAVSAPPQTTSIFGGSTSSTPTVSSEPVKTPSTRSITGTVGSTSTDTTTTTPAAAAAEPAKPSLFGGASATKPEGTSIFGGAAQTPAPAVSAFGSFGQAAAQVATPAPATSTPAFSFKPKEQTGQPAAAPAAAFSFAPKPSSAASGFAQAAAKVVEDGMMEDDMGGEPAATGGGGGFGSGFMSGLSLGGSSTASATPTKNVFGGALTAANTAAAGQQQQKTSWFGAAQQQATSSPSTTSSFGSFGAAAQQAAAAKQSVFGGGGNTSATGTSSVFGGAPKFGGSPAFGAKPVFGGGSVFGSAAAAQPSGSTGGSVFGGGAAAPSSGGFASFAGKSTFGSAAASAAATGTSSIFGGGSTAPKPAAPSVFGGSTQKSSFNTWR